MDDAIVVLENITTHIERGQNQNQLPFMLQAKFLSIVAPNVSLNCRIFTFNIFRRDDGRDV